MALFISFKRGGWRQTKKFYITYFTYGEEMPCYLPLPWLGTPSVGLENKIKASVEKCFFAVE